MRFLKYLIPFLIFASSAQAVTMRFDDVIVGAQGPTVNCRTFGNFSTCATSASTAGKTLVVDQTYNVSGLTITDRGLIFTEKGALNNSGTVHIKTTSFTAPRKQIFTGSGAIKFYQGAANEVYPELWGATGGVRKAVAAAGGQVPISLTQKRYNEDATIAITSSLRDTVIYGVRSNRNGSPLHGTEIYYSGTGAVFEIGSDNGYLYDGSDVPVGQEALHIYDGPQGLTLRDLQITAASPDTLASNGLYSYKAGTYGIKDWRGGDIVAERVGFKDLEWGFWGVQSDVNQWTKPYFQNCKTGMYFGPRSDQNSIYDPYFLNNDKAIVFDRSTNTRFFGGQWVGNASDTVYPIQINKGTTGVSFYSPWFEHYQGYNGEVTAFVRVGVDDGYNSTTTQATGVALYSPTIFTLAQNQTRHAKYLLEAESADVTINSPIGNWSNLKKIVSSVGSGVPNIRIDSNSALERTFALDKNGSATPYVTGNMDSYGQPSLVGDAFFFLKQTSSPYRDFRLASVADKSISFDFTRSPEDNNERVKFQSRLSVGSLGRGNTPTTGTYDRGDILTYADPAAAGNIGIVCTLGGTVGSYTEGLTANATGTTTITLSGTTNDLRIGQYLKFNGATLATPSKITAISGTSVTMSVAIDAGSNMTIEYQAPVWKTWGVIAN